ncbi:TetR/AcrR family transcriptional regulator [Desulfopila inferna]|uniref:TetR/AcrR family transcriptional regulator n=1 Tax=Desulfopila inferna TaxID=468528 RepID=UPI001964E51C|nr:TetR/AcrR family transcriptional regulator [Desulfopila inferna]MBM9606447.1 TetR/AcrR family transcriptional regulator [Desulfopila inferna]
MKKDTKETRQHILDTGYKLIVSKGFSSVGLTEILQSAGVPKGSFYYYFKSKEQFGEEIISNYFREYLVALDNIFQLRGSSAYNRLMEYWQRWIETQSDSCVDQKCLVVKLSAEVADLSEPMRVALLNGSSQVVQRIAQCIEAGMDDGSIVKSNSAVTADFLYNMWLGATLMSKLQRNADGLQQAMRITTSILNNNTVT